LQNSLAGPHYEKSLLPITEVIFLVSQVSLVPEPAPVGHAEQQRQRILYQSI
jgi:hypothetical protein